jgi:glycosyltransferase involved in cell wall biosynthesis
MSEPSSEKRLLFIQFGNYAEAAKRFASGGSEYYYAQRYTVDFVGKLVQTGWKAAVICVSENLPNETTATGVETFGLQLYRKNARPVFKELIALASDWRPTHLVLTSPLSPVLEWALKSKLNTLPLFADSFRAKGLRRRLSYWRLAHGLKNPKIRWVVNHGMNASEDLKRIGIPPDKILPFDWPTLIGPDTHSPKNEPAGADGAKIIFVGHMSENKGAGDCIRALGLLKAQGLTLQLTFVGGGDVSEFSTLAQTAGVRQQVDFKGLVPHERILELMNNHDVVVVPSRHEYPEGLPMTLYEGLCSRSPVVASDHPMFRGRIVNEESGMVFSAADPSSLAARLRQLLSNAALYRKISENAGKAAVTLFGPLKWDQILTRWLAGAPEDHAWLAQWTLSKRLHGAVPVRASAGQ